ncbi:MAG: hypothetical protein NUV37_01000 [Nanoarchaeota archaeon]|nr:hypothetical protein [Nanoarchaeota archaeon]
MVKKRALVLYSGGLDSRLAVKLMQDEGYEVEALYFALPFGCGCCKEGCNFNFAQTSGVKMTIIDVTKEPLLSEYIGIIKNPRYGIGAGINPCKDCKIFMFKKAKKYADEKKIKVIATGEVVGQRPMSQTQSGMRIIDKEIGFEIKRPLIEIGINGRSRKMQMALAEKYGIKYPNPGGGCFLCEKSPANRLKNLFEKDFINEKTLPLTMMGRHFFIDGVWFVVARDEKECIFLDDFKETIVGGKGIPSVYSSDKKGKENALKLQKAYSTGDNENERDKFNEWKL